MTTAMFRVRLWLRSLVLRRRLEAEMQHEMSAHLDRATERLVSRGLTPINARNAALREFGNMTYIQEEGRQARGARWIEALAADSRFAFRHFRRNPGATLTMLIVLAIGMSFATALFSFMYSYTNQRPLGVAESDDIVRIRGRQQGPNASVPHLRYMAREELEEYQRLTSHFSAVAGYAEHGVTVEVNGDVANATSAKAIFVTPNYFDVLGVRPFMGAGLPRTESAGTELVAVVSYALWEKFFARDQGALGATITLDGVPVRIVGVAPLRFTGVGDMDAVSVWMPIASRPLLIPGVKSEVETFAATARLAPGMTPQQASPAVDVIGKRAAAAIDATRPAAQERRTGTDVVPIRATNEDPQFDNEPLGMSIAFSLLATLVLLVTCTNVSALQTGLAMMRRREIAIRLAMGAGRRRIIRQLLTETVILATAAATAGLALVWGLHQFLMANPLGETIQAGISGLALAFAFGLALVVGVLFGLSPALHATRLTVSSALKDSTSSIAAPRVRLQRGLVIAQMALTQPLIVGVGLAAVMLWGSYTDLGLNSAADQIVTMRLRPAADLLQDDAPPQWAGEMRAVLDRVRSSPVIEGAVQDMNRSLYTPDHRSHPDDRVDGAPYETVDVDGSMIAPGYFHVMGIRLLAGRDFTESDRTPPWEDKRTEIPVIVPGGLAADLWPNANPLGRRLVGAVEEPTPVLRVVGVYESPSAEMFARIEDYMVYFPPDSARTNASLALIVRTRSDAKTLLPGIRETVRQGTTRLAVADIRTIADQEVEVRKVFGNAARGLGGAGLLILFLAGIGLYAVVSFAVGQRTSEIAVRMAVGANSQRIVTKFIGEGVRLGLVGLAIGLPLSIGALRILMVKAGAEQLPIPVVEIAIAAAIIVVTVALAATWMPARKAAGVDPALVLRRD
jgi:predicted permease